MAKLIYVTNLSLDGYSEDGWLQAFTKLDATLMNVQAVAADHREVEAWQS